MKLFSNPYRWTWRTAWKNVDHWIWDIRNGISNLFIFFEAVWWFRSWDWTGMAQLLRISAREMQKAQKESFHTGRERDEHQLFILETLCKRLLADEYVENAGYGNSEWPNLSDYDRSRVFKHIAYMENQDARYLGQMLRHIRNWWS